MLGTNRRARVIASAGLAALLIAGGLIAGHGRNLSKAISPAREGAGNERERDAIERDRFMFMRLRDPATNSIPPNIRNRELEFARGLEARRLRLGLQAGPNLMWTEAGPTDVGGRVRALQVDRTNSSTILTGGASGGIWKSTNGGVTWVRKTTPDQPISALAQDPATPATWYYATGELGSSAGDRGSTAAYYGTGLYKSTNNGETWSQIQAAGSSVAFDTPYDFVSNIKVSPTTGSVFIASNAFGILRSTDGGANFSLVLGTVNGHTYSDVDIASNGTIVAVLSDGAVTPNDLPGVYKSTNDGVTWDDITPGTFPANHERSVIAIAPSNADVAYVLTDVGSPMSSDVRLHMITISSGASVERTGNLPDFGAPVGELNTQGGYNMVIKVKPDDANFLLFGLTNLHRSTNGAATPMSSAAANWIGGYDSANNISVWPNHHPDNHAIAFDPVDPNRVWSGQDGGVSVVSDIRAGTINWQNKDSGLNVTQFYDVSVHPAAGDDRIAGGTQDNGTPAWRTPGGVPGPSVDITTGDGSHCYLGATRAYASSQEGQLVYYTYDGGGDLQFQNDITRPDNQVLFIHPYAVDPADETKLFFPSGERFFRLVDAGTSTWSELPNVSAGFGYVITATAVSTTGHKLYYAGYNENMTPVVYRLDNAHTATDGEVNISIPGVASGAYPSNIAVNPDNPNEAIVVFSNYNVVGTYHTSNGGATWTPIEGNLTGNGSNPGPSIRDAAIAEVPSGPTIYLVATSTGVYSTTALNGASTQWQLEGAAEMGNVVVEALTVRASDHHVAAGTHGRGAFRGVPNGTTSVPASLASGLRISASPNPFRGSTAFAFDLPTRAPLQLVVFDASGRKVRTLAGGEFSPSRHAVAWDGRDEAGRTLAPGVYLYRLRSPLGDVGGRVILAR